jgi:3-oxoadipate enol-lactonase
VNTSGSTCELDDVTLHYESRGEGQAIAFSNGSVMDTRVWDDQFSYLSQTLRVVRYDNRGDGKSGDLSGESYRYQDDLRGLLDHLGIDTTIAAGLSVGGGIALNFALDYPERVSGLVLMDTFFTGYHWPCMTPKLKLLSEQWQHGNIKEAVEIWYTMDWFDHIKQDSAKFRKLSRIIDDNAPRYFAQEFPPKADWGTPMIDRLDQIKVPTLLMVGDKDTPDNHEVISIIHDSVRHSKLVVVPDAGHMVNYENPSFVNRELLAFAAEIGE